MFHLHKDGGSWGGHVWDTKNLCYREPACEIYHHLQSWHRQSVFLGLMRATKFFFKHNSIKYNSARKMPMYKWQSNTKPLCFANTVATWFTVDLRRDATEHSTACHLNLWVLHLRIVPTISWRYTYICTQYTYTYLFWIYFGHYYLNTIVW